MSKIQWEYDLAERRFREQLKATDGQWLEEAADGPETRLHIGRFHEPAAA